MLPAFFFLDCRPVAWPGGELPWGSQGERSRQKHCVLPCAEEVSEVEFVGLFLRACVVRGHRSGAWAGGGESGSTYSTGSTQNMCCTKGFRWGAPGRHVGPGVITEVCCSSILPWSEYHQQKAATGHLVRTGGLQPCQARTPLGALSLLCFRLVCCDGAKQVFEAGRQGALEGTGRAKAPSPIPAGASWRRVACW